MFQKKKFLFFSKLFLLKTIFLFSFQSVYAFRANLAFWQMGKNPIATIDSTGLGANLTNDLTARSVTIAGFGILFYKAIVITSGTCTDAGVSTTLSAAPSTLVAVPFSFTPNPATTDTYFTVCAIGQNYTGSWQSATQPTISRTIRINTILPVVTSLALNNGVSTTEVAAIPISFSATHSSLNVTHFCFKTTLNATAPSSPASGDSCWRAVNNPQPGQTPSQNVSFSGFSYTLGFSTAEYFVFAWAKSESGAVSYLSSLGLGTNGTDKESIQFDQSLPPTIINVIATNTNSPSNPVTKPELIVPSGSTVYIKWKVTDDKALPATPIKLSFTTDEMNFTDVLAGSVANAAGAGCTVDGINHTGCYTWTNGSPTSAYVKFRVTATDSSGLIAYSSAPPNNTSPFEIIAGNTDPGLNSSAQSAILYPSGTTLPDFFAPQGQFVVRDDGTIFIVDSRGLMTISLTDGLYKTYLPVNGSYTDGPVASATLSQRPLRIALDYNNGLLIYDQQRIRRIDFNTNQITTIIGGGGTIANGTDALSFEITPVTIYSPLFQPLPNGDIWFATGNSNYWQNAARIFVYQASDQKIYQKVPTGTGSLEDGAFNPATYSIVNWGIEFDATTSVVTKIRSRSSIPVPGGHIPRSVSYNPSTMATTTPHIPFVGYHTEDGTINSQTGEMYVVDRYELNGLFKYNQATNIWDRILGTGAKGQCVDGTAALSCNTHISDAFISSQGLIYFVDRNRIRTIDANGNVLTLFGQELSFGDGGLATSARLSNVNFIDRSNDGKIILIDQDETTMREFAIGGNMTRVAGNGQQGVPDLVTSAVSQPLTTQWWGGNMPFVVNPTDGTIYFTRSGSVLSKLDRSTGIWSDIAGGGATLYSSADGLLGPQINLTGYPTGPNGFDGASLWWHAHAWNGTDYIDAFVKTYAISNGQQSALMGVSGISNNIDNCTNGSPLTSCRIQLNFNGGFSRSYWDAVNSRWLVHANSSNIIHTATPGGNKGILVTLPRTINAFTQVLKATVPHLYYCALDGRMYKYNLNTSTETALYWPTSTVSCKGQSVVWDSTRNSIIFPVLQNNLSAVAEIIDP